jgi:hypothetical protein
MPSPAKLLEQMQSVSFVANDFKWLAESSWGEGEFEFAFGINQKIDLQIFKRAPFFRGAGKPHLQDVGTWVLQSYGDEGKNLAVARVQTVESTYVRTFVSFHAGREDDGGVLMTSEHIAHFVSGIIMATGSDLVHVMVAGDPSSLAETFALFNLKQKKVLTLEASLSCTELTVWDVNAQEWWDHPLMGKQKKELKYVAGLKRNAKKGACGCKTKKRRIFRWGWSD